jgi:hypothetical protein
VTHLRIVVVADLSVVMANAVAAPDSTAPATSKATYGISDQAQIRALPAVMGTVEPQDMRPSLPRKNNELTVVSAARRGIGR